LPYGLLLDVSHASRKGICCGGLGKKHEEGTIPHIQVRVDYLPNLSHGQKHSAPHIVHRRVDRCRQSECHHHSVGGIRKTAQSAGSDAIKERTFEGSQRSTTGRRDDRISATSRGCKRKTKGEVHRGKKTTLMAEGSQYVS